MNSNARSEYFSAYLRAFLAGLPRVIPEFKLLRVKWTLECFLADRREYTDEDWMDTLAIVGQIT